MDKKQRGPSKVVEMLLGKGFYIVLFLCIAVIGVSAWILVDSLNSTGAELEESLSAKVTARLPLPSPTRAPLDFTIPTPPVTAAPPAPSEQLWQPSDLLVTPEPPEEPESWTEGEESVETFAAPSAPTSYVWPVSGTVETPHALETLIYDRTMADWRTHRGVDISATIGTRVLAAAEGTVRFVGEDPMYGTVVEIEHGGGLVSRYCNLAATPAVTAGQEVSLGQVLGAVGSTALAETGDVTHLHFEMYADGECVDPLDYLPEK